ncbi:MAG: PCP reductase family protein [Gemmatimonadota bacterium]|nr:PCP reductase family protein [Gemmatimonadota bacterium]MDH3426824.1 PCP reductase family protein [Gemmatimonadota bacterium]
MKFLCIECDEQMIFEQRQLPGDGTLAAAFRCPTCERVVAMLTNPMETQLVSSLGIKIGGREVPEQPLELVRSEVVGGREDAFVDAEAPLPVEVRASGAGAVVWSLAAVERLEGVPRFVRGMVKRIYADYAKQHGITEITPEIMDRARSDLGLEGM